MEIMLDSLMVSERREYLQEEGLAGNKCNGYRPGRSYGHGRTLTFRIPRDRYGNFHTRILAILPEGDTNARRNAQRGVCHPAHGKDGHGQEVILEAGAQNRS